MLFEFDSGIFNQIIQRRLTDAQQKLLSKQGIKTAMDFLLLQPKRYDYRQYDRTIRQLESGQEMSLIGKIRDISKRTIRKNLTVVHAVLVTKNDRIPVVWFNQLYVLERLKKDPYVVLNGALDVHAFSPTYKVTNIEIVYQFSDTYNEQLCPLYPDIRGISNHVIRCLIKDCVCMGSAYFFDGLPDNIRLGQNLLSAKQAIENLHFPSSKTMYQHAIDRLSFDELFRYLFPRRRRYMQTKTETAGLQLDMKSVFMNDYLNQLPYQLTQAQQTVWNNIKHDVNRKKRVFRLIQGDVGSGKTDIALLTVLAAYGTGYKGAILVPTELLAQQHYVKCMDRCSQIGVSILLLTGRKRKKEKAAIYDALKSKKPCIIVGTHALLQDAVQISKLGVVVIDEQHRFGVFQRQRLLSQSEVLPHCLFMTATPIPRTLMLTHYGDLDHDCIHELPPGRKPPKTYYAKFNRMQQIYAFIRLELSQKRQAYVVYPLIDESEHLDLENAIQGFGVFNEEFSEYSVALLHGKMTDQEKLDVMSQFKQNIHQILVSTTVIEVGVDVPNASVMVIMNADRFGLSQLHQLRGRIGRGADQSHCFLIADSKSSDARERIQAMLDTSNGFELAEKDLKIRGPGNLLGSQQSGDISFSFASIMDTQRVSDMIALCDDIVSRPNDYQPVIDWMDQSPITQQLN